MKRKREIASRVSDTIYIFITIPNPNYHLLNNQSDVFATDCWYDIHMLCCEGPSGSAPVLYANVCSQASYPGCWPAQASPDCVLISTNFLHIYL